MGLRLCLLASAIALAGCSPAGATEVLSVSAANAGDDPAAEPVVKTSEPASVSVAASGSSGLLAFLAPAASAAPAAPLAADFVRAEAADAEALGAKVEQAAVLQDVFAAAKHPPLPPARPDFGDRVRGAGASPTLRPETARSAGPPPLQIVAFAKRASLAAYEFKEAGVPLAADGPGPEQADFAPESFGLPDAMTLDAAPAHTSGGRGWRAAYGHVVTRCFPQDLRSALDTIAGHFNAEVLVTSGHRNRGRRGSLHRSCKAADIRVAGVPASEVARFARSIPGVNGVGVYRRIGLTHIDVRNERSSWTW